MKIYTIRDIAEMAGVSVTTVSRVLNHRPDVNAATRARVEKVIAECHFVGNANARSLKQTDADLAAVILRGHQNPFLNALAESILQHASGCKTAFMLEFIDEKADEFQTALRLSHEKHVKGFIFVGGRADARMKVLDGMDVPLVFTTVTVEDQSMMQASSVAIDDRAMGYLAMKTLLDQGHRHIAIFGAARNTGDNLSMRYHGALDACHDAGLVFDESRYVESRFSLRDGYDGARSLFAVKGDTTAVFAMSDIVAMGVIRALQDMGKRVPEDVSVFGFDGTEMGKYFSPRLTTIEQPVDQLAEKSVAVLLDMMENGSAPQHVTVDAALRMRESVAGAQET